MAERVTRSRKRSRVPEVPRFAVTAAGHEGCSIPALGLGTAGLLGDACRDAVAAALRNGYAHVDTALLYGNQEAVRAGLEASGVKRDDVFLTTKVAFFPEDADAGAWMFDKRNVKGGEAASIDLCLDQLGVDQVDLLLIHNPVASMAEYRAASAPHFFELLGYQKKPNALPATCPDGADLRGEVLAHRLGVAEAASTDASKEAAFEARKRAWRALEAAKASGKARMIGVSNYPAALLREMKDYATVMPAVNQIECHPRFASPDVRAAAADLGCVVAGYGLMHAVALGLENAPPVRTAAKRLRATPHAVVLKWALARGVVALPRSADAVHMRANLEAVDLDLTDDDLADIDDLDEDHPYYWWPAPTKATVRAAAPDADP